MGSEGPPAIKVHVTGFKKFYGVYENPTEIIVNNLKGFVERRGLRRGITLGSCTVLEAVGDGGLSKLYEIMGSAACTPDVDSRDSERSIWLHLGADGGISKFSIERQAVNEATFRCPDELGWQPLQFPIVPEDGGILRTRKTTCSTDVIADSLSKKGYDVVLSDDADKFVCNYVYYHSLRFAEQRGHKSLLVHVPLFSKIDEDTQMQFVASLLESLPSMYSSF